MTMSLLLQTTQGLSSQGPRGTFASLSGAETSPEAPMGFQTALRQAFDTRGGGTSLAGQPQAAPQEQFRDALAALGVEPDTLDEATINTLFSERSGGQALLRQTIDADTASALSGTQEKLQKDMLADVREAMSALGVDGEALDTHAAAPLVDQPRAPEAESLAAFRDALAALGVEVETLDDTSLSALFSATEQALTEARPADGEHLGALESLIAELNAVEPNAIDAAGAMAPTLASSVVNDTRLSGSAEKVGDQQSANASLDEVKTRLALMAAFAETPADTTSPASPAPGETVQPSAATSAPALTEAARQVLNAVNALRAEGEPSARLTSSGTSEARPAWNGQTPASFYTAATTAASASTSTTSVLESVAASAPLTARSDALPAGTASTLPNAFAPATPPGAEQAGPGVVPNALASTPVTASATINAPVTSAAFPEKLGQQLIQLTQRGGEQHVKLELHPAELGPLSITLKVSEQGTQAQFFSANAQVRQVVEQAIPQLREALAGQGIALGETSVGEHGQSNEQTFAQTNGGFARGGTESSDGAGDALEDGLATPIRLTLDGRVDLYA